MKVVLLLAGKGTRLLPLTESTPKPLVPVAGAPVLDHILSTLKALPVEDLILITGYLSEQIEAHMRKVYVGPYRIIKQARFDGTGGAVYAAREHIDCPVLVIFGDSLFDADLSCVLETPKVNMIWTQTVEDYQRFGIVQTDSVGDMKVIVEKPPTDVGRKANIGLYYISAYSALCDSLDRIMSGESINGEFYFTYALNDMVASGHTFKVNDTNSWYDCGTLESIIATNQHLLSTHNEGSAAAVPGVTLIAPVSINPGAHLQDCQVGPNVSIGPGCRVASSRVSHAILASDCVVDNSVVSMTLVGPGEYLINQNLHGYIVANGKFRHAN